MKKLLISAVFVTMLASPALAQSYNPEFGDANVLNEPQAEHMGSESYARSFGYAPREHSAQAGHWRGEDARAEQGGDSYGNTFGFAQPNADEGY